MSFDPESSTEEAPRGEGWRLRSYEPGDERLLAQQFERIFDRTMSASIWLWKLKEQPCAVENVWVGVDNNNRPIFQYAAMPRKLRLSRETVDALVQVDLWTDPSYRDRRIFTRSARWIHDYWRRAGVACMLSPFNEREEPRYARLGWRYLLPLSWQIRPLRPESIAARRLRLPALAHQRWVGNVWNRAFTTRREQDPVLEPPQLAHDIEAEDWTTDSIVSLVRGPGWIRWRYGRCPQFLYRVLEATSAGRQQGYLVYRLEETDGGLFAFVAESRARRSDDRIHEALITELAERLRADDVVAIATLNIPGSASYSTWRRRGFVFSWGSFYPHCLPLQPNLPIDIMADPRAWHMAGGDYDVI